MVFSVPILQDLFVSSFGHSEKRVVPWRLCASSHLGEPPQCFNGIRFYSFQNIVSTKTQQGMFRVTQNLSGSSRKHLPVRGETSQVCIIENIPSCCLSCYCWHNVFFSLYFVIIDFKNSRSIWSIMNILNGKFIKMEFECYHYYLHLP